MLYNYEAAILKFVNGIVPDIKTATYAKDAETFKAMTKVLKYPSFFFYRDSTEWDFDVKYDIVNNSGFKTTMCPLTQTYIGKILVETTAQSQEIAKSLRLLWRAYPYVNLKVDDSDVKVALRLLSIKIDEERAIQDEKGAQRYVEFKWSSRMVVFDTEAVKTGLVEEVRIYQIDGESKIDKQNLIKIIK